MKRDNKTVMFSDDANFTLYFPEYPATRRQLNAYISRLAEKVDIISWDCVVNGVCWYDSRQGPNIWDGRDVYPVFPLKLLTENIKALSAEESNPPQAVAEECHKHGIKMFACIRMGLSIHDESNFRGEGGVYRNCNMTDDFYNRTNNNTDLSLEAEVSRKSKNAMNLDFSHQEVQDLILRPCEEMASIFPIDGFELNFIRGGIPFESHEAEAKAPIMTEFVGKVRKILDESAKRQDKERLLLAVRVPNDPDFCRRLGYDVGSWAENGFIDIIAPDTIHRMIFDAHIDRFKEICKGRDIKILPCLHPCPGEQEPRAVYRAGLDNAYRQGADGFSTFNFSYYFFHPYDGYSLDWFDEFRQEDAVAENERIFPVLAYTVPQDDLYNILPAKITFRKHETDIRKTVRFPRILALEDFDTKAVLRFRIKGWSGEDELTVDIDGKKLEGLKSRQSIAPFFAAMTDTGMKAPSFLDPKALSDYEWDAFDFEVPAAAYGQSLKPYSEIGFIMVKRTNIASDILVKDIRVVVY